MSEVPKSSLIGKNVLRLNQATMAAALQQYLNREMVKAPMVTWIGYESSSAIFVVTTDGLA
jgi:hypothetical protein